MTIHEGTPTSQTVSQEPVFKDEKNNLLRKIQHEARMGEMRRLDAILSRKESLAPQEQASAHTRTSK